MSEKRTAILDATLELISQRGFHNTPMSLIAKEANVGPGTIYRNFENKEALINQLFVELKRRISEPMLAGLSEGRTTEEIFQQIWRRTFQYCLNHSEEMLFLEQYHNSPFLTAETEAATREYQTPILGVFQNGVRSGDLKDMPFEMFIFFVWTAIASHAQLHLNGVIIMDEDKLSQAIQACWDAVKSN
ncbi:MAG: TetR/AcrR family transcriptional regulator [Chloroflexota bacterium]